MVKSKTKIVRILIVFFIMHLFPQSGFALTDAEIQRYQTVLEERPVGERIALWAEKFIGTPYDQDPLGEYVSRAAIVVDERVDCMYLTFRVVELAISHTPAEAIQVALDKRFHTQGILKEGKVANYEDRFEYGEDMISSGKWGREITNEIGVTLRIKGSRGREVADTLSSEELFKGMKKLKDGDILFFIKKPKERRVGEIVGHIGILKVEQNHEVYLIHASGTKERGGMVKKVLLKEYTSQMPFIGVKITRIY